MKKQKLKFIISKSGNKKPRISFFRHIAGRGGWSEWVYPTPNNIYLFKCCDCGLVHDMEFGSLIERNRKGIEFEVVKLPPEIRVMFRARRNKTLRRGVEKGTKSPYPNRRRTKPLPPN